MCGANVVLVLFIYSAVHIELQVCSNKLTYLLTYVRV